MTTTLAQVVAGVQNLTSSVAGIRLAPDSLPDAVQVFPAVLVYPVSGTVEANSAGWSTELHVIGVDLLVDAGDWAKSYAMGTGLIDLLLRALIAAPTLGGTVQTYGTLTYTYTGIIEISGMPVLRWAIQINDVKIQHTW